MEAIRHPGEIDSSRQKESLKIKTLLQMNRAHCSNNIHQDAESVEFIQNDNGTHSTFD